MTVVITQGILSAVKSEGFIFLVAKNLRQTVGHGRAVINHQHPDQISTV